MQAIDRSEEPPVGGSTEAANGEAIAAAPEWQAAAARGPRTLAEKAFTALHDAIISGALAPGERLPLEELASGLGMSHLPVREAMRRLESIGLVEHTPHRGGRVTRLSLDDLYQLYDARLLLEPAVIERAAERFADEDAAVARLWLDRQLEAAAADNLRDNWSAHTEFHFALYRPSGASWILRLVRPLWESSQRYRMTMPTLSGIQRREQAHREHEQMLAECSAHDGPAAARTLYNHLVTTVSLVAEHMGGRSPFEHLP